MARRVVSPRGPLSPYSGYSKGYRSAPLPGDASTPVPAFRGSDRTRPSSRSIRQRISLTKLPRSQTIQSGIQHWASDEVDFYLYGRMDAGGGRGTNDFRGSKHNMLYSALQLTGRERTVCCVGRGDESVRLSPVPGGLGVHHFFNNHWAIPQSAPWNEVGGNDVYRPVPPQKEMEGTANLFVGEPDNIVMEYVEA